MKYFSTLGRLTFRPMWLVFFLLKTNKPIVPAAGVLPVDLKRGILTLTLVISRESIKPSVTRWLYVMKFNFFKVKTKLETQLEEYIKYKARFSPWIAEDQKDIISRFIEGVKHKTISEITLEDLDSYHYKQTTQYTTIRAMQALRAFLRYHKWQTNIKADQVTNEGIKELQIVAKNDIIPKMTKKRRVGRPANVAFIKRVKILKDKGGLGIRAIARAENMNPGNISRAYHYDLSKA